MRSVRGVLVQEGYSGFYVEAALTTGRLDVIYWHKRDYVLIKGACALIFILVLMHDIIKQDVSLPTEGFTSTGR